MSEVFLDYEFGSVINVMRINLPIGCKCVLQLPTNMFLSVTV